MNKNIVQISIEKFISGDRDKAIKQLEKYIKKNPSDHLAIYNLGYFYQQTKNTKEAIKNYLKVISINSDHWESKINLVIIYIETQDFELALKYVDEVLKIKENYQPALRDKALILYYLNRLEEALPLINLSIKLNSKDYIALNTLGIINIALSKLEEAKENFLNAIHLNRKYELSFVNLGRCFELLNLPEDSIKCFIEAEKINPNSIVSLNNIGGYYVDQGIYSKALDYFLRAYEKDKLNLLILSNLAKVYFYLDKYDLAEKYIKICLKINNKSDDYRKTYGIFLFKQKKYNDAWKFYEARLKLEDFNIKKLHAQKIKNFLWDGKNINPNEKILIIKEQGIGDEILYATMYSDLFKNFNKVKIESDPKLINLLKKTFHTQASSFFPYGFFSSDLNKLKDFDVVMYAGSLGKLFRKSESDFPKKNLFNFESDNLREISNKLNNINKDFKIGISWKSFRDKVTISNAKSIFLKDLMPIINVPKITLINLQYGDVKKDLEDFNNNLEKKIITLDNINLSDDLESVAKLLCSLDLFISISNTTAHLAGALGVETWLISPPNHASFHYWNQINNETPWYKNIKLYDCKNGKEETILKISNDLKNKFL